MIENLSVVVVAVVVECWRVKWFVFYYARCFRWRIVVTFVGKLFVVVAVVVVVVVGFVAQSLVRLAAELL